MPADQRLGGSSEHESSVGGFSEPEHRPSTQKMSAKFFFVEGQIGRISWSELIATLTILYAICIASFNAGYFDKVPNQFVQLFSFSDMLGASIPILQYLITLYFIYVGLFLLTFVFVILFWERHNARIERVIVRSIDHGVTYVVTITLIVLLPIIIGGVLRDVFHNTIFTLEFTPFAAAQWIILYAFVVGFKHDRFSKRNLLVTLFLNVLLFSFFTGRMWMQYEILSPLETQAMVTSSNGCIDRKLLRSSSSGYLLYSFQLKQFEFREKSDVKIIYASAGCSVY